MKEDQFQCQFEQQPKYPRCDKPATKYMVTQVRLGLRAPGERPVKHRYCNQHFGFVFQQLKGTYVRVIKYGST